MAEYDSDSSLSDATDDVSTTTLLGYASKEATDDNFSQLGGRPNFFTDINPSADLVTCRCCNDYMTLLLQLNADLPSRFPGHERRLYVWACKKKQCRRKEGSVRGIRGVRVTKEKGKKITKSNAAPESKHIIESHSTQDLGSTLFGAQPSTAQTSKTPFSMSSSSPFANVSSTNPFATAPGPLSSLAAKPPQRVVPDTSIETSSDSDLPATFADKVRISNSHEASTKIQPPTVQKPWPDNSAFPQPYPAYYLDAETEYLSASDAKPANDGTASYAEVMDTDADATPSSSIEGAEAESDMTHHKTFQHFADRVAQNPEQVLRYEFGGDVLLYSRSDAVGSLLHAHENNAASASASKVTTKASGSAKGMPRCEKCGARRVFELQLMPHAITELEAEEEAATLLADGMEWGTIILGVCEKDCVGQSNHVDGDDQTRIWYTEEWVGVQWEEVVQRRR